MFWLFWKKWFYCRTVISRDVENVGENSELDANSAVNNIHEYPFCKFRRLIILIDSLDWSSVRCPTKPLMIFARIYFPRTSFCKSILCFLQYLVLNCLFSRFLSCKSPDTPEVRGGFASNEDGAATTAFGGAHSSTADELWQELRFIGRRMTYLFFGRSEISFVIDLTKWCGFSPKSFLIGRFLQLSERYSLAGVIKASILSLCHLMSLWPGSKGRIRREQFMFPTKLTLSEFTVNLFV